MEETKANITIDEQNRIRIVEVQVFRESDQLRNDCLEFIKSNCFFPKPQKILRLKI